MDFDNLLLTVMGKGKKERRVPLSYELRKVLYKHLKGHPHSLVFSKRDGGKLRYDKVRPDFNRIMNKLAGGRAPAGVFRGAWRAGKFY